MQLRTLGSLFTNYAHIFKNDTTAQKPHLRSPKYRRWVAKKAPSQKKLGASLMTRHVAALHRLREGLF